MCACVSKQFALKGKIPKFIHSNIYGAPTMCWCINQK